MTTMASQITSLVVVYSIVYSGADQRKHQSSASLAFVRGIHRWPVNSPHEGPVTQKMFPFDDVALWLFHQVNHNGITLRRYVVVPSSLRYVVVSSSSSSSSPSSSLYRHHYYDYHCCFCCRYQYYMYHYIIIISMISITTIIISSLLLLISLLLLSLLSKIYILIFWFVMWFVYWISDLLTKTYVVAALFEIFVFEFVVQNK